MHSYAQKAVCVSQRTAQCSSAVFPALLCHWNWHSEQGESCSKGAAGTSCREEGGITLKPLASLILRLLESREIFLLSFLSLDIKLPCEWHERDGCTDTIWRSFIFILKWKRTNQIKWTFSTLGNWAQLVRVTVQLITWAPWWKIAFNDPLVHFFLMPEISKFIFLTNKKRYRIMHIPLVKLTGFDRNGVINTGPVQSEWGVDSTCKYILANIGLNRRWDIYMNKGTISRSQFTCFVFHKCNSR